MELCIPLSIIYGHPAINKASRYCCFKQSEEDRRESTKITNVLGLNIQHTQTANEYFDHLESHWK